MSLSYSLVIINLITLKEIDFIAINLIKAISKAYAKFAK